MLLKDAEELSADRTISIDTYGTNTGRNLQAGLLKGNDRIRLRLATSTTETLTSWRAFDGIERVQFMTYD